MIKRIHQIWIGDPIIERYKLFSNEIRDNHMDYEYIFWDEEMVNDYFQDDQYYRTLRRYQEIPYAFITNYCRLRILQNLGGWYIDSDCEYINSLNNILIDKPVLVGLMNSVINNAVIYSDGTEQANIILEQLIEALKIDVNKIPELFPVGKPHNFGYNHLNQFRWICSKYKDDIQVLGNNYFYTIRKESAIILHHKCSMSHLPDINKRVERFK